MDKWTVYKEHFHLELMGSDHVCDRMRILESTVPQVLYPLTNTMHAETITRNYTYYTSKALRGKSSNNSGAYSFTTPYNTPWVEDHITSNGIFGSGNPIKVYGRTVSAKFVNSKNEELGVLKTTPAIVDEQAIMEILDGRWRTVSMGSRVTKASCSECGADLINDPCDHWRGDIGKEGNPIHHVMEEIFNLEVSRVTVPSDPGAMFVDNPLAKESARVQEIPTQQCYLCAGMINEDRLRVLEDGSWKPLELSNLSDRIPDIVADVMIGHVRYAESIMNELCV